MSAIEQALMAEAKWVMDRLVNSAFDTPDRNYYQGRLDQLAEVRRLLGHNHLVKESERA